MTKFILIVISYSGMVVVPGHYDSRERCDAIAADLAASRAVCIPSPDRSPYQ